VLGEAPEFVGNERWFNTPGGRPLTLSSLRGRVVLVDFWTYSCINCIRTFPYLKAWDRRYRKDGLTIVGVHSPEFPFEREADNVETAIHENDIRYPVAQDNELDTWNAYANQYWPAEYFIDAHGRVRYAHFGEGEYEEKEKVIRELLTEAGEQVPSRETRVKAVVPSASVTTPETYLGAARAERFTNPRLSPGSHDFTAPKALAADEFAYRGRWRISLDSATAVQDSSLSLDFGARRVYLVLGSPGAERRVQVLLDGRPISASDAGADVRAGAVTVTRQRLYSLVDLPRVGHHVLTLKPESGVTGYAFTFG
jgi:thiol-disulfide isomerase/thioredoxin